MDQCYKPKAIVVLSGGLDSSTALYWANTQYNVVGAISFDYGQRHKIELEHAKEIVKKFNQDKGLQVEHKIVAAPIIAKRSSLTNKEVDVPHGHYEEDTMKVTVVNNRNSIMFSLATAWAIDMEVERVIVGIHAGDHAVYPDCRTDYIRSFNETMRLANEGFIKDNFAVVAPFVQISKNDIAELGILLGVPIAMTYSDYEGGEIQKGRSGTSVERIEAISIANARLEELTRPFTHSHKADPTQYEDKDYALNLLIGKAKEERKNELLELIDTQVRNNFFSGHDPKKTTNCHCVPTPFGLMEISREVNCDEEENE